MNRRILSPLLIFTVVSAVFVLLVVYPVFNGIRNDYNKAILQKQELAQLQEDQKRLQELGSALVRYEQQFIQLENLFLDTDTPIEFFRFLDTTAAAFQVELRKTPGIPQKIESDPWPSMTIQLEGTGTYPNVLSFLEKVEYARYILELKSLSITRSAGDQVQFSASAKIYTKE